MHRSVVSFHDLSPELQNEVVSLQKRMAVELQPLVLESTLTIQKLLECPDHSARLGLLKSFVESESKRLNTKKAIKGMFAAQSKSSVDQSLFPSEEQISDERDSKSSRSERSQSFFSDDDAFQ